MAPDTEITPGYIADPANREALRERANNVSNVNPVPTTKLPVKSQAVDGPLAEDRIAGMVDAGAAVVDPRPQPQVPPDLAEDADAQTPAETRESGGGEGDQELSDSLSRDDLNARAAAAGVSEPEKLANKGAVIDAIKAAQA